jgi:succinyl-CoA synthetase beta subunit
MRIHEYQAKQILADFGVPVPAGKVAHDPEEAAEVFAELGGGSAIVKAQSYGFAAGTQEGAALVRSAQQAAAAARRLIGSRFGAQTIRSRPVNRVLVEQFIALERSFYLAVVMDPVLARPVMVAASGLPEREPAAIPSEGVFREVIDPRFGTLAFQWRKLTAGLGLDAGHGAAVEAVASGLYRAFIECECVEAEIGQVGMAGDELLALDARMRFDDAALYRHGEIAALWDPAEAGETENTLWSVRMPYVPLGGRVGCVMRDTGAAIALLDRLAEAGVRPGGVLYLDGEEGSEKAAFGIGALLRDEATRAVIVDAPREPTAARRVATAVQTAREAGPPVKPVVVIAESAAARSACAALAEAENVRLAASQAEAAELVGADTWA